MTVQQMSVQPVVLSVGGTTYLDYREKKAGRLWATREWRQWVNLAQRAGH